MSKRCTLPGLWIGLFAFACALNAHGARAFISFDADWRFHKGDVTGAESRSFADESWRKLDVPHDWSIEGPFAQTNKTGAAGGWLPAGVGWYRKHFTLPAEQKGSRVLIEFDGVMQNSEVWINGVLLGKRPNGYVSFGYDLTPHVRFGKDATNVVAVRSDTSQQPASRWYSGAGIYRHVRLTVTDRIHLEPHATFVTTPVVRTNEATVRVATRIRNESAVAKTVSVIATIHGPPGSAPDGAYAVAAESPKRSLAAGESTDVTVEVKIPWSPRLWSVERPDLHQAWVRVRADAEVLDDERVSFGVRQFEFRPDTGFWLNGKNFKLYGVCLHHDGGAFGAAVPVGVWEHRLTQLRELGCNAIRTAHNPPAPEFLDLCDRMGFLVMGEFFDCWASGKNRYDYHLYFDEWSKRDIADTVRRDRNHPSIVLWSIGNEIRDTTKPEIAIRIARGLVEVCHENDPTRPVTQALFRPNVSGDYTNGLADLLDVVGTNYRDNELLAAQRDRPERKIVGTEQRHDRQTWLWCRDNPSHSGQFLWVGVDYLGESRSWPRFAFAGGLLDRTGEIKPMALERQSWWSDKPMVGIVRRVAPNDLMPEDPGYGGEERYTQVQLADWTPRRQQPHDENVEVYSNGEEVELFLNGKSLGTKTINANALPRSWKVAFEPGTLKAQARNGGSIVATDELRTAGRPVRLQLTGNRKQLGAGWDDVAFIRAVVVDENGVRVPLARDEVEFMVDGPGMIVAVDNGDNLSHEAFQTNTRRAYGGICNAMVKAAKLSGKITVTARAKGLRDGIVEIETGKTSSASVPMLPAK